MYAANSDNSLKKIHILHNKGKRIELTHFHKTSEDVLFEQQWDVCILQSSPEKKFLCPAYNSGGF